MNFVTNLFFPVKCCYPHAQLPSWRTTPCRLSASGLSIYSQLPSIAASLSSIRNPRMRHAVGTGIHNFIIINSECDGAESPICQRRRGRFFKASKSSTVWAGHCSSWTLYYVLFSTPDFELGIGRPKKFPALLAYMCHRAWRWLPPSAPMYCWASLTFSFSHLIRCRMAPSLNNPVTHYY
jgi:hypothetical protein